MYPNVLSLAFLVFLCGRVQGEVSVLTQLRNIPAYANLPGCQSLCIGGSLRVDPATTYYSAGYSTSCKTKDCFCGAGQRTWLNNFIWDCVQNNPTSCRSTGLENNYNGAMTFLGEWCGFPPVLRDVPAAIIPSSTLRTTTTSLRTTTTTTTGARTSDIQVADLPTASASSSPSSNARTSPSSSSVNAPQPSQPETGSGNNRGGLTLAEKLTIGLSIPVGIAAIIGTWLRYKSYRLKKRGG